MFNNPLQLCFTFSSINWLMKLFCGHKSESSKKFWVKLAVISISYFKSKKKKPDDGSSGENRSLDTLGQAS